MSRSNINLQTNTSTKRFFNPDSESKDEFPNLRFYKNEIPASPNMEHIEKILQTWSGDYTKLEENHNYIQWLFPNRLPGVNRYSNILIDEEAKIIRETPELKQRVKRAFEMMLDFYGMRLTEDNNFELTENSEERLQELNQWKNHNFLRITRILLALKELGHNRLTLPWMKFMANLIYKERKLDQAKFSFEKYWISSLDAEEKLELIKYQKTLIKTTPAGFESKDILRSSEITDPISKKKKSDAEKYSFNKYLLNNKDKELTEFKKLSTENTSARFESTDKSPPTKITENDFDKYPENIPTKDIVSEKPRDAKCITKPDTNMAITNTSDHVETLDTDQKQPSLNLNKHYSNLFVKFNQFD